MAKRPAKKPQKQLDLPTPAPRLQPKSCRYSSSSETLWLMSGVSGESSADPTARLVGRQFMCVWSL